MAEQTGCKVCNTGLTPADIQSGKAVQIEGAVYCWRHDPRKPQNALQMALAGEIVPPARSAGGRGRTIGLVLAAVLIVAAAAGFFVFKSRSAIAPAPPTAAPVDTADAPAPAADAPADVPAAAEMTAAAADPDIAAPEFEKLDPAFEARITAVNRLIDKSEVRKAFDALAALKPDATVKEQRVITMVDTRIRTASDELFRANLDIVKEYMDRGDLKTAVELLEELQKLALYPHQEKKRTALLDRIGGAGTDERSLAAQSLFLKAEALAADNGNQAYDLLVQITDEYRDTPFYKNRQPEITARLSALKRARLEDGNVALAFYADFDAGPGDWKATAAAQTDLLTSGAVQLGSDIKNPYAGATAVIRDERQGLFSCPASGGYFVVRYNISHPARIYFRMVNAGKADSFWYKFDDAVPLRWMWAAIPLASFTDMRERGQKIGKGDKITGIEIEIRPEGKAVTCLIDEVAVCFNGLPGLYQKALKEQEVLAAYTRSVGRDYYIFDNRIMSMVLSMSRSRVKSGSILVFGDSAIKGLNLRSIPGTAVTEQLVPPAMDHKELVNAFSAALKEQERPPEIAVILTGADELKQLLIETVTFHRKFDKQQNFSTQEHSGSWNGWYIWLSAGGKTTLDQARTARQAFEVHASGAGENAMPKTCTCPDFRSRKTCSHIEFLTFTQTEAAKRASYAESIERQFTTLIGLAKRAGTVPVLITPPVLEDRDGYLKPWVGDYGLGVFRAAQAENAICIALNTLQTDSPDAAKYKGGSTGISSAGYAFLNEKLTEIVSMLRTYCFGGQEGEK